MLLKAVSVPSILIVAPWYPHFIYSIITQRYNCARKYWNIYFPCDSFLWATEISCTVKHYNNSDEKKRSGQTIHSIVQCECRMLEYEHLFRHHPGADSARAQVRPEQHTLISVFKLNSCKLCQFKHLRARRCELTRAVRRFVRALIRSVQTRASERAQILSSLWSIVFEWTNSHKHYVKMPVLVSIL